MKEVVTITIPKGGRPKKEMPDQYYIDLATERSMMTARQMAEKRGVSIRTIQRDLQVGRAKGIIKI